MLDIDLEEELVKRVGGKFALTVLLQRRMVELNRGDRPLIRFEGDRGDNRRIACQEILEGKISLSPREEIPAPIEEEVKRIDAEEVVEAPPASDDEIYGSDIKKIKEQRIKELSQLLNPNKK